MEGKTRMASKNTADVWCNECGAGMMWGAEYQLDTPDDQDALCPECHWNRED